MAERLPQMLDLARSLMAATHEGRVNWSRHQTRQGQFDAEVAGSMVSISSEDQEGTQPFILVLWDEDEASRGAAAASTPTWHPLESLSTRDLLDGAPDGWVRMLAQLWRVARTQALKVDERLDAVLAELTGSAT